MNVDEVNHQALNEGLVKIDAQETWKWQLLSCEGEIYKDITHRSTCPIQFFQSSSDLRQGDSLLPYLFILAMEVHNWILRRATGRGFILGFNMGGRIGKMMEVSHLLFIDGTLIFCDANQEHLEHLVRLSYDLRQ